MSCLAQLWCLALGIASAAIGLQYAGLWVGPGCAAHLPWRECACAAIVLFACLLMAGCGIEHVCLLGMLPVRYLAFTCGDVYLLYSTYPCCLALPVLAREPTFFLPGVL